MKHFPLLPCVVLVAGCAAQPHLQLAVPGADAAASERIASYQKLHPKDQSETVVTDAHGEIQGQSADFLILGGGDIVYHAEDLVPVVPRDSKTAEAAARGLAYRDSGLPWQIAGAVAAAVGLGLAGYGVATD